MLLSPIGLPLDDLDTPALLLDLDAFDRNARTMSERIRGTGKQWRPHAKAFKSPAIAHALLRAGAFGVTVAKVSEAEVMAAGGLTDILIAHLVVGPRKAARLAALQRHADVKATVDHPEQISALREAARGAGTTIGLLVDVNLGMNRTGVGSAEEAVALAGRVADTPGLRLDGVMGYEGHTLMIADPHEKRQAITAAIGRLTEAAAAVRAAGLPCPIVSAGGTGSYQYTADIDGATELQSGGGVFACRYYTEICHVVGHVPSIGVRATVVSRPAADRAILDAGKKTMSDHKTLPVLIDFPGSPITGLSAEHATVRVAPEDDSKLRIGQAVMVTPGYSDLTFVLHDRVLAYRSGRVEAVWPLLGRGMLQ